MRLWPIIPIVSAFCLGAFAAKTRSPAQAVEPAIVQAAPKNTTIIPKRANVREDSGALSASMLDNISFPHLSDGKITAVAQKLLDLTATQTALIEAAVAEHDKAIHTLDQKLGLQATIIEQTEEQTVIDLPDDAEARHAIKTHQWESIHEAVGKIKARRLIQGQSGYKPHWKLVRTLTLSGNDAQILQATMIGGKRWNPQRSAMNKSSLESPWKEIAQRLDL